MPFKEWPNDAGFNASVETRKPVELVVHGRIPASVAGTLYRTGPGHYKVEDTPIDEYKLSHWFDGFTQIHRFQLIANDDGSCKVLYNSRRQVDQLLEKVRKTGRLDGISFGQKRDPCASYFQKLKSVFEPFRTDNPQIQNVGVTITPNPSGVRPSQRLDSSKKAVKLSNFMVVKTDSSQMKSVDMETLEPIGVTNQRQLHPDLKGPLSCAHAQYDPENGDVFNYNLDFGKVCTYRVFKTSPATGDTDILATIADAAFAPAYIHSFFLTHDFVILAVWSSHIASYGISILWERNMLDSISPFDPNSKVKWLVIDRRQGRGVVASFESPAAFSFHSVNAWQEPRSDSSEGVDIFCDVIQYPTLNILHRLYYDNLVSTGPGVSKYVGDLERESTEPSLTRYRLAKIPLGSKTLTKPLKATSIAELIFQVRSPLIGDLPTINPLHATRRSRYIYSLVDQGYSSFVDGIAKFDTLTKVVVYWMKPKHTPGEAIFVPDPTREGEDAGFLLSVILNGETGTSYLLCLDAKDMKEAGRAEAGVAVGFGFHGTHISS
ncbi:retinal pigment epithelial membrane family protein [Bisporella sp. PMI_857]|nr:retinal pigment epithelial membrane family protein [Bisporella sp. PMI_857]